MICGLRHAKAELCCRLLRDGTLSRLMRSGRLGKFSQTHLPEFKLALQSQNRFHLSFGEEWCGELWRRAALAMIEIIAELAPLGLAIQRPQSWYFQFDGVQAKFIHPGAIFESENEGWDQTLDDIFAGFLLPVALCAAGDSFIAQVGLRRVPARKIVSFRGTNELLELQRRCRHSPRPDALALMRQWLESIRFPDEQTSWSGYYVTELPPEPTRAWGYKQHALLSLIQILEPTSILDIGSNTGWFARLGAAHGASVIAIDQDEVCINRLCRSASNDNILPLRLDIVNPTPSIGFGGMWFPASWDRLRAQLVLALAITHHMALGMHLSFDQIAAILEAFTSRWLVVEFVPWTLEAANPYRTGHEACCPAWYAAAGLMTALSRKFKSVEMAPGPARGRRLIICEN